MYENSFIQNARKIDNQSSNLQKHANKFHFVQDLKIDCYKHIRSCKSLYLKELILAPLRGMKYTSMRRLPGISVPQNLNKLYLAFMMFRKTEKSHQKYFSIFPLSTKFRFIPISQGFFTKSNFQTCDVFLSSWCMTKLKCIMKLTAIS